jgi:glycosyltransferase involved in cell wall biosynthesis
MHKNRAKHKGDHMQNERKPRILVSGLAYDDGKSGISEYIQKVVEQLSKLATVDFILLEQDIKDFSVKNSSLQFLPVSNHLHRPLLSMLYHLYILPRRIKKWKNKYDLVFLPAGNRRLLSFYPIRTVVTIHDLSQFHITSKYDKFRMFYIMRVVPHYLKLAQVIMAVSEQTKKDMVKFYHIPSDKIVVNHNGFSQDKFSNSAPEQEVLEKYNLSKPYFLYISRIEHPGKNHLNLIKAYELLPEETREKFDLVLGGSDWNGSEEVHNYAKQSHSHSSIRFLGYVPNTDLKALYERCAIYIFPSLWEGFGLSLLEAMACGAPVICSNCSSLPEVGGNAVLTFDPQDPKDISKRILEILEGPELRKDLIHNGFERVKEFSWERHTERIMEELRLKIEE